MDLNCILEDSDLIWIPCSINNTKNTNDTSGSSSIESFVLKKIKEN